MAVRRSRSLGSHLAHLEVRVPSPSVEATGPRTEDEWLAAFEELGRDGYFDPEPEFPEALELFRDALAAAHASADPPFDPPLAFEPHHASPYQRLSNWRTGSRFPDLGPHRRHRGLGRLAAVERAGPDVLDHQGHRVGPAERPGVRRQQCVEPLAGIVPPTNSSLTGLAVGSGIGSSPGRNTSGSIPGGTSAIRSSGTPLATYARSTLREYAHTSSTVERIGSTHARGTRPYSHGWYSTSGPGPAGTDRSGGNRCRTVATPGGAAAPTRAASSGGSGSGVAPATRRRPGSTATACPRRSNSAHAPRLPAASAWAAATSPSHATATRGVSAVATAPAPSRLNRNATCLPSTRYTGSGRASSATTRSTPTHGRGLSAQGGRGVGGSVAGGEVGRGQRHEPGPRHAGAATPSLPTPSGSGRPA
jgi:hypothetical protein